MAIGTFMVIEPGWLPRCFSSCQITILNSLELTFPRGGGTDKLLLLAIQAPRGVLRREQK